MLGKGFLIFRFIWVYLSTTHVRLFWSHKKEKEKKKETNNVRLLIFRLYFSFYVESRKYFLLSFSYGYEVFDILSLRVIFYVALLYDTLNNKIKENLMCVKGKTSMWTKVP